MSSFLEKLKRGMDLEKTVENFQEETPLPGEETEKKQEIELESELIDEEEEPRKIKKEKKAEKIKIEEKSSKKTGDEENESGLDLLDRAGPDTSPAEISPEDKKTKSKKIADGKKDKPSSPSADLSALEKETKIKKKTESSFSFASARTAEEGQLAIDAYQTENDLVIQSAIAGVKPENLDVLIERDIVSIRGSREKPLKEAKEYFNQECFWGPFSREIIIPVETDPQRATAEMKNGILTIRIPKILRERKRKIDVKEEE